jgi:ubiquinone/menaquinone biosynthesis C-methylase UbiE
VPGEWNHNVHYHRVIFESIPDRCDSALDVGCGTGGDFRDLALKPESIDLVTAVASLHHMDTATAIDRMRDLLRPKGVLVVIGLAREGLSPGLTLTVPAFVCPA